MSVFLTELKKLLFFPVLWIYLAICLFANLIITVNEEQHDAFNKISAMVSETGQRTGEGISPVYETYDVDRELTSYYTNLVSSSPMAVRLMERKYSGLQKQVDHLGEIGADMDLYAGPVTTRCHQNLFSTLLRTVCGEVCVLAMLLTVYLLGYEKMHRTELYFFGSRTGRKMLLIKTLVSLLAGVMIYVGLTGISLGIYFTHWDFSGVWDAHVASQFHTVKDVALVKPFLTLADFTVKEYLWACLGLSLSIVVAAVLFAAVIGMLIQNTYVAGLLTLLLPIMGGVLTSILGNAKLWTAYFLSLYQPVNIWLAEPVWFTEGGLNAPSLWFETKGMAMSLVIFGILLLAAWMFVRKRDIS